VQRTELCPIKGFTSWEECAVRLKVLLLRERYADGHQQQWGLMTTADFTDPGQLPGLPAEPPGFLPPVSESQFSSTFSVTCNM
jgi:hypothetical protein